MAKRRSVLIVSLNYWPETTGIAPYVRGLAVELTKLGNRVRVLTSFPHYPQWSFGSMRPPWKQRVSIEGVRVDRFRHSLPSRPIGVPRLISELSFGARVVLTRWGRPDAIVLLSPALFASALALVRGRLLGRPVVTWVQDLYSLGLSETGNGGTIGGAVVRGVERFVLRRSTAVVVIHTRFRDEVTSAFGVSPDRIHVVRNWSHLPEEEKLDRLSSRRELGWEDDEIIALHAGNIGVKQGLENVVKAASLIDDDPVRVRFVLLGDGNQRSALQELAHGVGGIQFLDPLPEGAFQRALRSADVLIVNEKPGISGMAVPSKLTSYFSTGLPVVAATDAGSVTEREVRDAGAGVAVAAGDPAKLLAAVREAVSDPARAAEYGRSARRFRAAELSASAAISRYDQILSAVTGTPSSTL